MKSKESASQGEISKDFKGTVSEKPTKCTYTFMKTYRRLKWERDVDWDDEDEDRLVDSREALEEDIQDYEVPMVIVGSDVISLYPNLDVEQVVKIVEDEVKGTDMKFSNVDYLEATRHIVLNLSSEECRRSILRRVLPWRRGRRGTKPGITGAGPLGQRGDQEQWEFPQITLKDWEKREILATVLRIATRTMFTKHYYSFGGRTYHQRGGGPIGLRGTCAIARLIMQVFDR